MARFSFLLSLFLFVQSFGQLVEPVPYFFSQTDSVTIIFDAAQGNQGLLGYTGDVYAHTGLITSSSSGSSDWRYVKTNWGDNTPATKLTRIGTDLYQLKIGPSILAYYNVPAQSTDEILQVAFVFRSASSPYREAKTIDNGDIFVDVSQPGLNAALLTPDGSEPFVTLNQTVSIKAVASSQSQTLSLYLNGDLVSQTNGYVIEYAAVISTPGKTRIIAAAEDGSGNIVSDSTYVIVRSDVIVEDLPAGVEDGINYSVDNTSATLVLFAPEKEYVYVIGDFTGWEFDDAFYMKKTPDGKRWWIEINGLTPGTEYCYQYFVDGSLRIADYYSELILDPWNDWEIDESRYPGLIQYPFNKTAQAVSVLQPGKQDYLWRTPVPLRPTVTDLVIYELLIRDFTTEQTYQVLIDTLNYLKQLGVNAIELMPVTEFEGNNSWGYNPMFYFAPDKFYGPENKLKEFIDVCHHNGIAVILDMVLNHSFGQSSMVRLYWDAVNNRPAANSPWFNPIPKHPYNVGYDFNHESEATKYFAKRVMKYWLEEFHVDGFRFDLSKGFTQVNSGDNVSLWGQFDQSRINIWNDYYGYMRSVDSTAYIILEHFADNTEEKVLANSGMMLWGNMNYDYNEATMGYASSLLWGSYKARGWLYPNLVTFMESHDEERLMFKNIMYGNSSGAYDIKNMDTALERVMLASAFFYTVPGPKMLWQFGELGYDVSINYDCRVCPKPVLWEYYESPGRRNLYKVTQALTALKQYDAFSTSTYTMDAATYVKRIAITHESMNVTVIGNFNVTQTTVPLNVQNTGWWYDYFSGDSTNITNTAAPITLQPGEFHIYTTVKLPTPEDGILTEADESEPAAVDAFYLDQNYPNPFNPNTVILYSIKDARNVSLKVYDVLGNEVAVLVDEYRTPGVYSAEFSGENFASGVYFYTLRAGSYTKTNKMILVK